MRVWGVMLGVLALSVSCTAADTFQCSNDAECANEAAPGHCEPSQDCSFDDGSCASGRRYSVTARDLVAGACVPEAGAQTAGLSAGDGSGDGGSASGAPTSGPGDSSGGPGTTASSDGVPAPVCGNGIKEGDEVCDGTDLGGLTCEGLGMPVGDLHCNDDCSLVDSSGCGPCKAEGEPCEGMYDCCGSGCGANGSSCIFNDVEVCCS